MRKEKLGGSRCSVAGGSQRRGAYIGELATFMKVMKLHLLNSLDDDEVARRFVGHVEARIKRGHSVLKLPNGATLRFRF